jgi:hypothetical protein
LNRPKILEWQEPENISETKNLHQSLRLLQDLDLTHIVSPIYHLFQSNMLFGWAKAQVNTIDRLKEALVIVPALMPISYEEGAGEIILAIGASLVGVLMQLDKQGRRHHSRYESSLLVRDRNGTTRARESCRGLLKMSKKVRHHSYGVRLVTETDAKTPAAQLNRSASDVPGALVTRWLAWIHLFDFDVHHVFEEKFTTVYGLSRRLAKVLDEQEADNEEGVGEFIAAQLAVATVAPLRVFPCSAIAAAQVYPFGFSGDICQDNEEIEKGIQGDALAEATKKPSS